MLILPLVWLPLRLQFAAGKGLGLLVFHLGKRRRQDTLTNLSLCFPEYDTLKRQQMARQVYINAGIGIFESLNAWFRPQVFAKKVTISGLHHLVEAQQQDRGILLFGAHYTLLDLGGLLCSWFFKADIVYRPQNNPLLEWFIHRARQRIFRKQIAFLDIRALARSLKDKRVVWYTPDQDFGLKHGVMAPFFGINAATITAPRRLAKIGDTAVMAVHFYRQEAFNGPSKRPHYHITITPELTAYPSPDEQQDAARVNTLLETLIRNDASQYMWFHRRFKTQINGHNPYK